MRIAHINISGRESSTGRIAYHIIKKTSDQGGDGKLFYVNGIKRDEIESEMFEYGIAMYTRKALNKIFGYNFLNATLSTKQLIKRLNKYQPNIVHIHVIHHGAYNYRILFDYLEENQIPVVITLHDCWFFTGDCYHYTNVHCINYQFRCENCPKQKNELDCKILFSQNQIFNIKDEIYKSNRIYFVAVSNWLYKETKKSTLLKDSNVKIIYNGVDRTRFNIHKNKNIINEIRNKLLGKRKFLLIAVASYWTESKGITNIVKLSKLLGDDYMIVLIGNNKCKNLEKGRNNIYMYGPIYDDDQLSLLYASADLILNLSTEESFGMVTAEAFFCGTKTVGFASTANTELLKLTGGIVVEDVGNLESMSQDILNFMLKRESKEMVINEQNRRMLCSDYMAEQYLKLYREIVYEK